MYYSDDQESHEGIDLKASASDGCYKNPQDSTELVRNNEDLQNKLLEVCQ